MFIEILLTLSFHSLAQTEKFTVPKENPWSAKLCDDRRIHLTFDDGPNENTMKVFSVLRKHKVPATFFMVMSQLNDPKNRQILKQLNEYGLTAGIHGYTHMNFSKSPTAINQQFNDIDRVLELNVDGEKKVKDFVSPVMRLPYGAGWDNPARVQSTLSGSQASKIILNNLKRRDWSHMGWHIDTEDYKFTSREQAIKSADDIIRAVKKNKGGVILFHDTKQFTPMVLDLLISKLYGEFCFVDLPTYSLDKTLKIIRKFGSKTFCQ